MALLGILALLNWAKKAIFEISNSLNSEHQMQRFSRNSCLYVLRTSNLTFTRLKLQKLTTYIPPHDFEAYPPNIFFPTFTRTTVGPLLSHRE